MRPSIVIITGLSGSGKTVALRALEDNGFTCVDNLPPQLMESYSATVKDDGGIAIGVDIRRKDFFPVLDRVLPLLREKYNVSILFLEAERDVLVRRFKETRRPHPLMEPGMSGIEEAISREKGLMMALRERADNLIDTSRMTPHQLRQQVISIYTSGEDAISMNVTVMSFGFKYGAPQNADLLFDVRFLPNPHFVPELKDLDGRDEPVRKYVLEKPLTAEFVERLEGMLEFLIPNYRKEGKAYLTIGIGCTGGRHRSIAVAEEVAAFLRRDSMKVNLVHRDL